jgi:hypothetical protein
MKLRGMIGMLLTDRDAHLMPKVMHCLDFALEYCAQLADIELILSLRESGKNV